MKILLVTTNDWLHHRIPSRHTYIFEEIAKKHEVHVPHFHVSRGEAGTERETKCIIHEATKYPVQSPFAHYLMNAPHHFSRMKEIIRTNDIDCVVASHVLAGSAAISAARKQGIPVLFDVKDWYPDSAAEYYLGTWKEGIIRAGTRAITNWNLSHSNVITTVSPSLVEKIGEQGFHSTLITNGVNTDILHPVDPSECDRYKELLGFDEKTFIIGFVGALETWFDLDQIIAAMDGIMNYYPRTVFLIVGGSLFTDYELRLRKLVSSFGLEKNVIFAGIIPYEKLLPYIAAMDVCVMPFSKWRNTTLPNKFFEYTACRKPILSTPLRDVESLSPENYFIYHTRFEFICCVRMMIRLWREGTLPEYTFDVSEYDWRKKAEQFMFLLEYLL